MPNSIITQDQDGKNLFNAISSFFSTFGIGNLLRKCNAQKEKGIPVIDIFKYKLCNVFSNRSMYMQHKTGSFKETFSKNTFYRFLNNSKTNWMRFTTILSKKVADTVEPLTNEDRINAFVVDDSLFERTSCKKTELGSRIFDHTSMKYRKGYRLMTLGWTDGNTFLPVNSSLLASSKASNLIGPAACYDGRSLAGSCGGFGSGSALSGSSGLGSGCCSGCGGCGSLGGYAAHGHGAVAGLSVDLDVIVSAVYLYLGILAVDFIDGYIVGFSVYAIFVLFHCWEDFAFVGLGQCLLIVRKL